MQVRQDWPDRQIAGFLCQACGRTFMRHYAGALHYKNHGDIKRVVRTKPAPHMATARRMGLEGVRDRDVDVHFRWESGTAKTMWIKMGLLGQVRHAQAQKRHHQLDTQLRMKVTTFIQDLPLHPEPITMKWVAAQLGHSDSFLGQHHVLHAQLRNEVAAHNTRVRHHRLQLQRTLFEHILSELRSGSTLLTLQQIAQSLGCKVDGLAGIFPDLFRDYKNLRKSHCEQLRNALIQKRVQQIDSAARRLAQRGDRLSKASILKKAGFNRGVTPNPLIDRVLCQ
jgi:AraC-like DNA-binding protein